MYEFKPGEYKTRDGRRAVVLSDEYHNDEYELIGAIEVYSGKWMPSSWTIAGVHRLNIQRGWDDLMPPEEKRWMNVYPDRGSNLHKDKETALDSRCTDALGTIELTFSADKLVEVKIV